MSSAGRSRPAIGRSVPGVWMESLPLAGLLGLLLQAALATALLRFWLRQGESFYLLNVGNASGVVYVVELVAWVVGFMLLILGRVRAALQMVVAAAVLSLVLLVLDLAFSGDSVLWRSAVGVSLVGLVPAACLLLSRGSLMPPRRPLVWLAAFVAMAVAVNLTSDGTAVGQATLRLLRAGPFTVVFVGHTITTMSLLDAMWLAGLVVGAVAWWRWPRVTAAIAVLMLPHLVEQFPLRLLAGRALAHYSLDLAAVGLLLGLSAFGYLKPARGAQGSLAR
jgi:hypothetical protein